MHLKMFAQCRSISSGHHLRNTSHISLGNLDIRRPGIITSVADVLAPNRRQAPMATMQTRLWPSSPSHRITHYAWWRHQMETFPRHWPFVKWIHQSLVDSPHKGQWRTASAFSLICLWTNGWAHNRNAGILRRHGAHYDATVMEKMVRKVKNSSPVWIMHDVFQKYINKHSLRFPRRQEVFIFAPCCQIILFLQNGLQ